mmetsp:Transcript_38332/g.113662  ORF Transcript_38332/g.113662 Transcript_38332/m.113662 type:complete len:83 (+) Transcript_38332:591-839(+)|eukprot:362962-Chlamydomonas_euryale.AAC.1
MWGDWGEGGGPGKGRGNGKGQTSTSKFAEATQAAYIASHRRPVHVDLPDGITAGLLAVNQLPASLIGRLQMATHGRYLTCAK